MPLYCLNKICKIPISFWDPMAGERTWRGQYWYKMHSYEHVLLTSGMWHKHSKFVRNMYTISQFSQIWLLTKIRKKESLNTLTYCWVPPWTMYINLAVSRFFSKFWKKNSKNYWFFAIDFFATVWNFAPKKKRLTHPLCSLNSSQDGQKHAQALHRLV
jgi:hypothetical protein